MNFDRIVWLLGPYKEEADIANSSPRKNFFKQGTCSLSEPPLWLEMNDRLQVKGSLSRDPCKSGKSGGEHGHSGVTFLDSNLSCLNMTRGASHLADGDRMIAAERGCYSLPFCSCSKWSTVTGSVFMNHPSHPKYNQQPVAVNQTSPGVLQFT